MKLPAEERDGFIQAKFDQLFSMGMADVNNVRIEGKQLILTKGDFTSALENFLLRAYISLERIDLNKHEISKNKFSEQMVKILKLIYVCISLRPEYIEDQWNQTE
jgi:hypothetical protein